MRRLRSIAFAACCVLGAPLARAQMTPATTPPPPASVTTPPSTLGVPPTPAPANPGLPAPPPLAPSPSSTGINNVVAGQLRPPATQLGPAEVAQVQSLLAAGGFYHGPIDGTLGGSTLGAVRAFQNASALPATGQLDAATIAALGAAGAATAATTNAATPGGAATSGASSTANTTTAATASINAAATNAANTTAAANANAATVALPSTTPSAASTSHSTRPSILPNEQFPLTNAPPIGSPFPESSVFIQP